MGGEHDENATPTQSTLDIDIATRVFTIPLVMIMPRSLSDVVTVAKKVENAGAYR